MSVYLLYSSLAELPFEVEAASTWEGVMSIVQQYTSSLTEDGYTLSINPERPQIGKISTIVSCGDDAWLMIYCLETEEKKLQRKEQFN